MKADKSESKKFVFKFVFVLCFSFCYFERMLEQTEKLLNLRSLKTKTAFSTQFGKAVFVFKNY